jgi:hypothetical protein
MKALVLALVNAYLSSDLSLREFHDLFIPATWDIQRFRDPDVVSLIRQVQLALAELSSGDITEPELRAEFDAMMPPLTHLYLGAASLELTTIQRFPTRSSATTVEVPELVELS